MRHLLRSLRSASLVLATLGAAGAAWTIAPTQAHAQAQVFTATRPGNVIAVGNTLGLSKETGKNGPGTADSIGTFISLDPNSVDTVPVDAANPWFAGTTNDWTMDGSSAALAFPNPEAEVLYAELVWGGSYDYGGEDVTASLDVPVTLSFGNDSIQVAPDGQTGNTINYFLPGAGVLGQYYNRSADVTSFVKSHFSGTYSVSGVPATQSATINSLNAAGWTLVVAYRSDNEPIRNMTVYVGNSNKFVDENQTVDYSVSGFCAPPAGDVKGTIAISALEGDANRVGDQLLIAPDTNGPFVNLAGPNNPSNNFFASQINGADGLVDPSGTFGDAAHQQDAINGTNVSGGRQGWDVTTVQISSSDNQLFANQTAAVLRTRTLGDSYLPVLSALAIEVNAPSFSYNNSPDSATPAVVHPGDTLHFSATLKNDGLAAANDVQFTLALPAGLTLASFDTDGQAGDINHTAVTQPQLASGVAMGNFAPQATHTVDLTFTVGQASNPILLKPIWKYDYVQCTSSGVVIPEEFKAKTVSVTFESVPTMTSGAGGAGNGGAGGSASTGSSSGGAGGDGSGNGLAFPQGGGFCAASPVGELSPVALFGFAVVAGGLAARRRRRG